MRRHLGRNQSELKVEGCENPQMRRDSELRDKE